MVGAAYVIWLGVQAIRHRSDARRAMADATPVRRGHPVRIGFTVGATNPKTIVFFVAFLPQFTDPGGPVALQTMLLGLVFGVLAAASDSTWAIAAGTARTWFARRPTRLDTLSATGGTMMIGLGATMLTVD
jgi:threonine/homoserine/homoserine lactone efflux protein